MPGSGLTTSTGDYLKAIWIVGQGGRATTNALASQLGVSAPSVSGMLGRLEAQGWVVYERYRGAMLTERGRREALRLIRRHRLIETFLIDYLGYSWDEVHEEAEAIEHVISDRFTERLAGRLGHPTHDPHGDPIPSGSGGMPATPNVALVDLQVGDALTVARLRTQDAAALNALDRLRIRPGQVVTIEGRVSAAGRWQVRIGDEVTALSDDLAAVVRGEPARDPSTPRDDEAA